MSINPEYRTDGYTRPNGNGDGRVYVYETETVEVDATATAGASDASIGTLLKELAHEVPALLRNEIALAKSEMRENMKHAAVGAGEIAAGGAIALAALVIVMLAAVYALSYFIAPWLAALVVGVVGMIAGYALVKAGMKKLKPEELRPDRTIESLREDKKALKGGSV